mmetsp:Transcript_21190/g.53484  ORF Transcript_21190/g.53484 Transcript_21190/m.53484 type:complete len:222 (-) Transcript_21190:520-1185(-)
MSVPSPSACTCVALMGTSSCAISCTMLTAAGAAVSCSPYGRNVPRSLSITMEKLGDSLWCTAWYWSAPTPPNSSHVHSTARSVRFGFRPSAFTASSACREMKAPPASSMAPCSPGASHESRWPLTSTTSCGTSTPVTSAIRLRDLASGRVRALIFIRTVSRSPRSCMRWSICAASTVMHAPGMDAGPMAPVWGEFSEKGVTERMRAATAPYLAARDAPAPR